MKLVDNWMRTHRKFSAQAAAAVIAIEGGWTGLKAAGLADALPPGAGKWVAYIAMAFAALGILGGMVDQGAVTAPPEDKPQ